MAITTVTWIYLSGAARPRTCFAIIRGNTVDIAHKSRQEDIFVYSDDFLSVRNPTLPSVETFSGSSRTCAKNMKPLLRPKKLSSPQRNRLSRNPHKLFPANTEPPGGKTRRNNSQTDDWREKRKSTLTEITKPYRLSSVRGKIYPCRASFYTSDDRSDQKADLLSDAPFQRLPTLDAEFRKDLMRWCEFLPK